jgi:hypothetical protein
VLAEGADKGARMSRLLNEAFLRFGDRLVSVRPSEGGRHMGLS